MTGTDNRDRFVVEGYEPSYLTLWRSGELDDRAAVARSELAECRACPRDCAIDRLRNETAQCHTGRYARVASAFAHFGEEDCLRGSRGSGTIFFAFCNLRCVFCQNWDISQRPAGPERNAEELAAIMLQLQQAGCHNINLVTPEHVVPQVVEAIAVAAPQGLRIPIVYNTSAYDAIGSLQLMDGIVDIYMPDFKFWEPDVARRLARAADYPQVARRAVKEMHRQVGPLVVDSHGIAQRGVLVRHLVMPGQDPAAIFTWLAKEVSPDTFVNIMAQYRPEHRVPGSDRYRDIDRRVSNREVAEAFSAARRAGLWRFDG